MTTLDVAVVSRDPAVRLAAARAFDQAPPSWSVHLHDAPPAAADVIVYGSDVEADANGIVFDPHADRSVIDEVRRSVSTTRAKAFVVAGAGRGVGVTSLALHLAAASARTHDACFLDLDLEWGAGARLGMPEDHLTWEGCDGARDVARVALPVAGGFRVLLAPHNTDEPPGCEVIRALVANARRSFERVVVDCPDDRLLADLGDEIDAGVLVLPATPAGARRARRSLGRHETLRWALVLNRLGPGGETTRAELHDAIGRRPALELPPTPALRDAEDDDALLTWPWRSYVRVVDRLLRALEAA